MSRIFDLLLFAFLFLLCKLGCPKQSILATDASPTASNLRHDREHRQNKPHGDHTGTVEYFPIHKIGECILSHIESTVAASKIYKHIMAKFSLKDLQQVLDEQTDQDISYIFVMLSSLQSLDKPFFTQLDEALAPRIFWTLRQFVLSSDNLAHTLVFQKPGQPLHNSLLKIQRKNFPATNEMCSRRPLAVANIQGDTWGNRASNTVHFMNMYNKHVTYLDSTITGRVRDVTPFASPSECTDKVNRHECLFLPSTNCTLPSSLHSKEALVELADARTFRCEFLNSSEDGKVIPAFRPRMRERFEHLEPINIDNAMTSRSFPMLTLNRSDYYLWTGSLVNVTEQTVIRTEGQVDDPAYTKFNFGYIHRYNAEFNARVQHMVDKFRVSSNSPLLPNSTCVMIHMRQNDRRINNTDMFEWCKNHVLYDKYDKHNSFKPTGANPNGDPTGAGELGNYGCGNIIPYGAMTLEHYLNASLLLAPDVKQILVATDDQYWLHQSLQAYKLVPNNVISRNHLKLYRFHARHNHRYENSIETAAEFFATIELGRQCQGYIGFISTSQVARFFFEAMCYRHAEDTYLSCPSLFNFGVQIF